MTTPKPLPQEYLLRQRICCGSKCQNCPYLPKHTTGSTHTFESILEEPVSYLEYFGLQTRTIDALENAGFFTIRDLRKFTALTVIPNLGDKSRSTIKNALESLFRGDPPMELDFNNTT